MSIKKNNLKVACIQTVAGSNFVQNLERAIALAYESEQAKVDLIAFPEMFLYRGSPDLYPEIAHESNRVIHKFPHIAKLSGVSILLGSILEKSSQPKKYHNTSFFISRSGAILSKYRKIHLFDVKTPNKTTVQESKWIAPGRSIVLSDDEGIRFGLSICFDLRFPNHYQALVRRGAQVIFVPSNFLRETGRAHWHALLRARAIENQAFVIAPAQAGANPDSGQKSFGHSMIVNPWGEVLAEAGGLRSEVVVANLDLNSQLVLRRSFPVI